MELKFLFKNFFSIKAIFMLIPLLSSCNEKYSYREVAVPEFVKLSKKLDGVFLKTKLVCFGRYALQVPAEAQLIFGGSAVDVVKGGAGILYREVAKNIEKIKWESNTAEITYSQEGPVKNGWQIRYYESESAKEINLLQIRTFIEWEDFIFLIGDAVVTGDTEAIAVGRQFLKSKNLRLRNPEEVPTDPGLCFEHGFLADRQYKEQEIDNAGIYLPSLPDVTFSISSNKDAYGDYPPDEFEKKTRAELSLLNRIEQAKKDQGSDYPSRTLLREGKRDVQHWHGEESLIRRTDGVHDFEWTLVGTPRDIANPSALEVRMFTKVEHNTVGAASAASLSDDEAIALWDKLLSGLKFRVKVPGAPPGSYYIDPDKPAP